MIGHRVSSLPLTAYCGQAPAIREKFSGTAERPAKQSSYFHAVCAGRAEEAAKWRAQLTPEELSDTDAWFKPTRCELTFEAGPVVLEYADAVKELEIALDEQGEPTNDNDKALTVGHLDFAWPVQYDGQLVAFVCDLKRSKWTVTNPNSLQILTYGWAYAKMIGATAFVPGIWALQEGSWSWGDWVSMDLFDSMDLWSRIHHAATNRGPASIGPHCQNCFARLHCPEYCFPKSERSVAALAVMQEGADGTPEEWADAVLWAQSVKTVADRVLDNAKARGIRGLPIMSADGRRFNVAMRQGRETADIKRLRANLGDEAEQYIKRGEPFPYPSWSSR